MINGSMSMIIPPPLDDSMSNLTCASNEAASTISSSNRNHEIGLTQLYHHHQLQLPPSKKRRNLPGNPDPDAEVVALSPRTLMTTNRFICEICNKGFQRDQNLQLHRRGHNLPWKLKQRTNKELPIKKKVYVCPEVTCVHHDPARALGDLTGIKKHFFRKHGEKKWKCEKCSKRYAVQSDWKAHSKICGTREYRCDCGTLFSRRDSFITHRAFCDALAEESTRLINAAGITAGAAPAASNNISSTVLLRRHLNQFDDPTSMVTSINQPLIHLKREQQHQDLIPPWLLHQQDLIRGPGPPPPMDPSSSIQLFPARQLLDHHHNQNQNSSFLPPIFEPTPSPHMSATALLQKAAQMGVNHSLPEQTIQMGISTNNWSAPGLSSNNRSNSFEEAAIMSNNNGMLNNPKLDNTSCFQQDPSIGGRGNGNGNEELTRDFLGLRAIPPPAAAAAAGRGIFTNTRGIQSTTSTNLYNQQTLNHHQTSWQG
ncbi:protein indeterminate-domain 7-like [Impatiens glandulifera]|uniref:protein indeterminate-domain 7-like n=1 Tax=Impatiens glandulifera TaxID=253017 RepID=UPI001FB12AAB|nr:protein indeterminate-domain 7-like [Impatiens glandulifera]XP_047329672.1 protein indeterminate-domain 7-like [Impatiens glandulifera]